MPGGLFVSWIHHHGRSASLAEELGLRATFLGGRPGRPWSAPARYVGQAAATLTELRASRPDVVVAMAPPLPLVLLLLVARARPGRGGPVFGLVVDAHTKAVLGRGGRAKIAFPVLARRTDLVLVAAPALVEVLAARGVRSLHVHDPLPRASPTAPTGGHADTTPTAIFPATWSADEPLEALIAAAAKVPGVRLVITGRVREDRRPAVLPTNVELCGFLPSAAYDERLASADVVLALTTREDTMQRAGYEGLALGKPLVASDTAALRAYFGDAALFADPTEDALADALARCAGAPERMRLAEASARRRDVLLAEERAVLASVRDRLVELSARPTALERPPPGERR